MAPPVDAAVARSLSASAAEDAVGAASATARALLRLAGCRECCTHHDRCGGAGACSGTRAGMLRASAGVAAQAWLPGIACRLALTVVLLHALLPALHRSRQQELGAAGAVEQLASAVGALLQHQGHWRHQQQQQARTDTALADALLALLFACCGHEANLQRLAQAGGAQQSAAGAGGGGKASWQPACRTSAQVCSSAACWHASHP